MAATDYISLIQRYFPRDQWQNAYQVMVAESTGDPGAHATEGEDSRGLFQLNVAEGANPSLAQYDLYDPETNVRLAAQMYQERGWQPWTTARTMGLAGTTPVSDSNAGIGGNNMAEPTQDEMDAIADEAAAAGGGGFNSSAPYGSSQYWSDYLAYLNDELNAIQGEIAANPDMAYTYGPRLGQLQTAMNQAGTQYRQAVTLERQGGTAAGGGMTAYQQAQVGQAAADRQTQLEIARMADQIRRGELAFQQAQAQFANQLANQRAAMEASKWAIPPGMQYFPQFGPGESAAQSSKILGAKFSPIDVQRMRYEPVPLPSPIDFSAYGQVPGGSNATARYLAGVQQPPSPYWTDPTVTGEPGPGYTPPSPYYTDPTVTGEAGPGYTPPPSMTPPYLTPGGMQTGNPWGTVPAPAAPAQPGIGPGAGSYDVGNYPWYTQLPSPLQGLAMAGQSIYNAPGRYWDAFSQIWR